MCLRVCECVRRATEKKIGNITREKSSSKKEKLIVVVLYFHWSDFDRFIECSVRHSKCCVNRQINRTINIFEAIEHHIKSL